MHEAWAPGVIKLSLHHPELGHAGVIYLDLLTRCGTCSTLHHCMMEWADQHAQALSCTLHPPT